jgi:hypothetical protein
MRSAAPAHAGDTRGQSFTGQNEVLPDTSTGQIARQPNVLRAVAIYQLSGENVYRSPYVPAGETGGIGVAAAGENLPQVLGTSMAAGHFLDRVSARYPEAVLGADAAQVLQITHLSGDILIDVGNTSSPLCCSALVPSRSWSARSGSPTSWSSPCSNAAAKSDSAAPSALPADTSPSNSSPNQPSSPPSGREDQLPDLALSGSCQRDFPVGVAEMSELSPGQLVTLQRGERARSRSTPPSPGRAAPSAGSWCSG